MLRKMRHDVRATNEFKDEICKLYEAGMSCANLARRISVKYGFDVSGEYISKVLHERKIRVRGNGQKQYSIYDAQLGPKSTR